MLAVLRKSRKMPTKEQEQDRLINEKRVIITINYHQFKSHKVSLLSAKARM